MKKVETINGIKCYAPELANENSDYPADVFKILYSVEDTNFWFVARNQIIQFLFKKHLGNKSETDLEIGCGTG